MPATKKTSKEASIETMLQQLETLVIQMESGELTLEASVDAYRRGAEIATRCQHKLSQIRDHISVLDNQTQTLIDSPIDILS